MYNFKFSILTLNLLCGVIYSEKYDLQPKILYDHGEMILDSARDRNISFEFRGHSTMMINEFNFRKSVLDLQAYLEIIKPNPDKSRTEELAEIRRHISGPTGLERRITSLDNITSANSEGNRKVNNFNRRITRIQNKVARFEAKIRVDDCGSNPCRNGGVCTDLFDNYLCDCPKNWEGTNCDVDVNECGFFEGTDLGCQNQAECVNTQGSYYCVCTNGWIGLHCTQKSNNCYTAPVGELCGNGICINSNTDVGYECICDQGWKTDGINPACTVDVDECKDSAHSPCVTNCTNLPGSFTCEPCPPGMRGNGEHCRDIDECEHENGGCSINPTVPCINTMGSYHCGKCPMGWLGDGKTCERASNARCNSTSICHPSAACQEISGLLVCVCPEGTIGDGVGPNGCTSRNLDPCRPNQCLNGGTCIPNGSAYSCQCRSGFQQPNCNIPADPCTPNPCGNGGTCTSNGTRFTCSCPPGFGGRTCRQNRRTCGGVLTGLTGNLKYPANTSYAHNQNCAWVIRTNRQKVLNVTFLNFQIESSPNCIYDWLQVHDGRSSAAQLIGRFCGSQKPKGGSIISTHNEMYLWFRSDNSTAHEGFELIWSSVAPICGEDVYIDSHGAINSPGYPGNAPQNRDCEWRFWASPGKRIEFTFFPISLGTSTNCSGDYLAIYNGRSSSDDVIEMFCNSSNSGPLLTAGNEAMIFLHTDGVGIDSSFQIHFSLKEAFPGCGGMVTQKSGTFGSPMDGDHYPPGIICEYIIQLAPGALIQIEFEAFQLEESSFCSYDKVEIYDGRSDEDPLVGRWCGTEIPPKTLTTTNTAFVKFSTDHSINMEGFRLSYNEKCGALFKSSPGNISSPNYPQEYPENIECVYRIEAPTGHIINLEFQDFLLEKSTDCRYDHVEFSYGYTDEFDNTTTLRYCSDETPPPQLSTLNHLSVMFLTDYSIQNKGFFANYSFIDIECGGILKDNNGIITIPVSEQGYRHHLKCTWIISLPENQFIFLKVDHFDLENSEGCSKDYLEFSYKNQHESTKTVRRYCGTTQPPSMTYMTNFMKINFESDSDGVGTGFELSYSLQNSNTACGGIFSAPTGEIQSPGFPDEYPAYSDCTWVLKAQPGNQIQLNVNTFKLESNCGMDYLEIRNGDNENSPPIGKYCGSVIPRRIPSYGSSLHIRFVSDYSLQYDGFSIEWDSLATSCTGTLDSIDGSIASFNYPELPTSPMECKWLIHVNLGSTIDININYVMTDLKSCDYDFLTIYDGPMITDRIIYRSCDETQNGYSIKTTSNQAYVKFVTDGDSTVKPFMLNYNANCNTEVRQKNGVIESPGFPHNYLNSMNCRWKIIGKKNSIVSIAFSHFELESDTWNDNCVSLDFIEIQQYKNQVLGEVTRYCTKRPNTFNSSGEEVWIKFISDYSIPAPGFRLEYQISGCGETLTGSYGQLKSPRYPDKYAVNADCEWIIRVDFGQVVVLDISELHIEADNRDCSANALLVATGRDASNVLLEICNASRYSHTLTSTTRELFVRFKTDGVRNLKYFTASFRQHTAECGGIYSGLEGYITSPHYPNNYPPNMECSYLITTDIHHNLFIKIVEFDIENSTDCNHDSLTIYNNVKTKDGTEERNVTGPLCGIYNEAFDLIESVVQPNSLVFKFRSDNDTQRAGFKIFYKQNCGSTIDVTGSGTIVKSFNHDNCFWYLHSSEPDAHLILSFRHTECDCTGIENEDACAVERGAKVMVYGTQTFNVVRFCNKSPADIVGPNSLFIYGITGSFEAFYSVYDNHCGGTFTSLSGVFASPQFPNSYPPNVECVWEIVAGRGNYLQLQFESFNIANSSDCQDDYVEVRQDSGHGPLMGVFCGRNIPDVLRVYEKMWIKFRSGDDDEVAQGFRAEYNYAMENVLNATEGTIESTPTTGAFPSNMVYKWIIALPTNSTILLVLREYSEGLRIYDGYDETASEIEFAATDTEVMSTTSSLCIVANPSSMKHFRLDWRSIPKSSSLKNNSVYSFCGDEILTISSDKYANLSSPNYPQNYENNLNCTWILKTDQEDSHVMFSLIDLQLESSSNCSLDYLAIASSTDMVEWKQLKHFCRPENYQYIIEAFHGTPYLKVSLRTDQSIVDRGFTGMMVAGCGANMTQSTGVIRSHNLRPATERFCQWSIRVRSGRRISLKLSTGNFDSMSSQPPPSNNDEDCDTLLMIKDGLDEESPSLGNGRYCTDQLNHNLESSSNRIFIKYSFRSIMFSQEWTLEYNEINRICGGTFSLYSKKENVTISSPNYPNIPDPYTECEWLINVPLGEAINITFIERFDLLRIENCTVESIQIWDGGTELASVLKQKFCTKPDEIKSSGNVVRIKYLTDTPDPRNGFKALITIAKCGGQFTDYMGDITSENYPMLGSYPTNSVCTYKIGGPMYLSNINITFNDIDLAYSENSTTNDYLIVWSSEKYSDNMTFIGKYYGNTTVQSFITPSQPVIIEFHTFGSNRNKRGFKIGYQQWWGRSCAGEFSADSGEFHTPNYPNAPPSSIFCHYRINVAEGRRIKLVVEVDGGSVPANQLNNFFTISNDVRYGEIKFNITENPFTVYSTQNFMTISMPSYSRRSQILPTKFTYTSEELTLCQADLSQPSGEINSPSPLPSDFHCIYKTILTGNETLAFHISYAYFLTVDGFCYPPSIEFMVNQYLPIQTYCSNVTNVYVPMAFVDSRLSIATRDRLTSFAISFKHYNCGGAVGLRFSTFKITNPTPNGENVAIDCAWAIKEDYGWQALNFSVTIDAQLNSDKEYLKIYNGPSLQTDLLGTYYNETKKEISFVRSGFFVHFHSEQMTSNSKFELNIKKLKHCGPLYLPYDNQPSIDSSEYKNNMECVWDVKKSQNMFVIITFVDRFFIEISPNCTKDFVEIREQVDGEWNSVKRFCGRERPSDNITITNPIQIRFKTDNTTTADGFSMILTEVCGGVFKVTGEVKTISTPVGYLQRNCNYTLVAEADQLIYMKFTTNELMNTGTTCSSTNFTIYKYRNMWSHLADEPMEKMGTYCKGKPLDELRVLYKVVIIYQPEVYRYVNNIVLTFTYHLDKCGGLVTSSQNIQNPTEDGTYPHHLKCQWNVTVSENEMIIIRFEYLEMENSYQCRSDFVEIYIGTVPAENNRRAKLCGNLTNVSPEYKITETNAIILLETDFSVTGRGFSANIAVVMKCDEAIYLNSSKTYHFLSRISSNNLNCHYQISAPDGYQLKFEILSLELAICDVEPICNCDYLELRDGSTPNAQFVGKYCKDKPLPFISTKNQLYLKFITDTTLDGNGFTANVTLIQSPCGASYLSIPANGSLEIKSPGWPNEYLPNIKCTWTLPGSEKLALYFDNFDLQDPTLENQCIDYLEIVEFWNSSDSMDVWYNRWDLHPYQSIRGTHRYCGNKVAHYLPFYTPESLTLIFATDGEVQKTGFKIRAEIHQGCNRNYTELQGTIIFSNDQDCSYYITVPEGFTISLHFNRITINECTNDTFGISIYNQRNDLLIENICDLYNTNKHVFTNTNALKLKIKTHSYAIVEGTYIATNAGSGCGGSIVESIAIFSSPMYPSTNRTKNACTWSIQVPYNLRAALIFKVFDMGSKINCESDYIKILQPQPIGDMQVVRQFCGEDNPRMYIGENSNLAVFYNKTVNFDGTGWVIIALGVRDESDANLMYQNFVSN